MSDTGAAGDDAIIGVDEAMAILAVSRATLSRAIARGDLTPIPPASTYLKRPRRLTFHRRDVEYLRDHPPAR